MEGVILPSKAVICKYLAYYAQSFNTVEVNNTFYRYPSLQMVQRWYQNTPEDFKFSLKVNKLITHTKGLKNTQEDLKLFYGLSDILKDKMGCFLFQFPKSFVFSEERLEGLLSALDPTYQTVVEFRHESWWTEQVFEALAGANSTFCTVSGLAVLESLIVSKGHAYIRLHGDASYASPYSEEDLVTLKKKIQDASVKDLWIYFNNTRLGCAPGNALLINELMAT